MLSLRRISSWMFFALLLISPLRLEAAWPVDGLPVCTVDAVHSGDIVAVEDGSGGAIFVWCDSRNGNSDIFAQRVDREGNVLWTTDGAPVCTISGAQQSPCAVSDGTGGVVIAWTDYRGGPSDIYAQRLDAGGTRMWLPSGNAICTAANDQDTPVMTTDGAGGAIIAWYDHRAGSNHIYTRRIDIDGDVYWTVWGEPVCTLAASRDGLQIASDGAGGAYIAWYDSRNSSFDIFCELVTSDGKMVNGSDGYNVCDDYAGQFYPRLINFAPSQVIIAWEDTRNGTSDLYVQRLNGLSASWVPNGTHIANAGTAYISTAMDEGDCIVFCWPSYRDGSYSIFAQRLHLNGTTDWPLSGIPVCESLDDQREPIVISDDTGGTIALWGHSTVINVEFRAQNLDSGGNLLWDEESVKICDIPYSMADHVAVRDGEGGALAAWRDSRLGYTGIYVQRLDRHGYFGSPEPVIDSAGDIPLDQGGKIELTWNASYLDPWPYQDISHYSIWKSLSPASAMMLKEDGIEYTDIQAINSDTDSDPGIPFGIIVRREILGAATYYWELLETQTAQYYEGYSKVLETDFTSLPTAWTYSYYQVAAHTSDPLVVWTSQPDSAYSLDNLSPAPPVGLAGEQEYSPEGMDLVWNSNQEEDLSHYVIYRGTEPSFVPSTTNMLTTAYDTMYFDAGWNWDDGYFYKVSAVDIHDNESGFALLLPGQVTGDDPPTPAHSDYLSQNWPNPFNPSTTIQFGLKESGHVRLNIYDASGRLVSELVNSTLPAGNYSEIWNGTNSSGAYVASGIYFYRLDTGEFSMKKKMVLLR